MNIILHDVLLEKFDMKVFLDSVGITLHRIGGRTQYFMDYCPYCGKSKHMGINFDRKTFGCFKCHTGGGYIKLLQKILNKSYVEVLEFLKTGVDGIRYNKVHIEATLNEMKEYECVESKIKSIEFPEGYVSLSNHRINYLDKGRTFPIPQDQVIYYKIGVCPTGKYANRIIVCDVNDKQEVVYWIARDISGKVHKSAKVWNPNAEVTKVGSSDILFNFYLAKNYSTGIITEGLFDALHVGNNGLATYGKGLKKNHIYWLLKAGFEELVLLYDADVPYEELDHSGCLLSQHFRNVKICKLPYGDPDEWPKDKLTEMINSSPKFVPSKLEILY